MGRGSVQQGVILLSCVVDKLDELSWCDVCGDQAWFKRAEPQV